MPNLQEITKIIHAEIEKMTVIDAHEHLPPEHDRLKQDVDALTIFSHYCRGDLAAAGMKQEKNDFVFSGAPFMERWKAFKPYYDLISNTTYTRAAHIALERFYGESTLTDANVETVTQRIKDANRAGLYKRVLADACGIETTLNQTYDCGGDPLLTPVTWVIYAPRCANDLGAHSAILGRDIANLDDLLEAARQQIRNIKKSRAVGIKYFVFLMSEPSVPDAREALSQIINNKELYLPPINPITHVYFDALLSEVKEQGLVACVHTGYWGDFRELNPSHAIYMFDNYPDVVFDLYHVGYPYVREAIMLGKSRGNVVMNMCWTYIISPHFAREALTEMLEMVPWHKIIGFGGDYTVVEKVYGHLVLARRVMADALAVKVHDGSFTLERAVELARRMMYQNPKDIYKL